MKCSKVEDCELSSLSRPNQLKTNQMMCLLSIIINLFLNQVTRVWNQTSERQLVDTTAIVPVFGLIYYQSDLRYANCCHFLLLLICLDQSRN